MKELLKRLEDKIKQSYEQGITLDEAEKLASEFLYAQLQISAELTKYDLDSRLRKNGVKSIRAAIYLDIVQKSDKKPTEAQIGAMIDADKIVQDEQQAYDQAEVSKAELDRYYDVFQNAHVHFRTVAKGRFE